LHLTAPGTPPGARFKEPQMSDYTNRLFAHADKIKAERESESLADAQAALDKAQARYNTPEGSSQVYAVARAQARVDAARAREMVAPWLQCVELQNERRENGGV